MARKVFISYRREDTAPAAGRLYDRLCQMLRKANVFFDVSTIGGGENFELRIDAAITQSDVVVALIGSHWLAPDQFAGKARIWAAGDYVRAELRAALQQDRLVLPVLVDGARMPAPEALPEDIRAVCSRNALPLRHESFDDDTENILRAIFGVTGKARPWDRRARLIARTLYAAGGTIAALLVLVGGALVHNWILQRPISASIGDSVTTLLLIAAVLLGIGLGLNYETRRRGRRLQ